MSLSATRAIRQRYTENPKTVLAFYATVLGLMCAAVIGAVATLGSVGAATWAIPWLLAFGGFNFVLLVVGVFYINMKDPSKLMLGRVSGTEFADIQRLTLGTSRTGERQLPISQLGYESPLVLTSEGTPQFSDDQQQTEVEEA